MKKEFLLVEFVFTKKSTRNKGKFITNYEGDENSKMEFLIKKIKILFDAERVNTIFFEKISYLDLNKSEVIKMTRLENLYEKRKSLHDVAIKTRNPFFAKMWIKHYFAICKKIKLLTKEEAEQNVD